MPVPEFYVPNYYEENFVPPNPYPLPERLRNHLKASVPVLSKCHVDVAHHLHATMLAGHPEFKNYLSQGKQDNGHQAVALGTGLVAYADNIHDISVLAPVVERVAQRHSSLNIQPWQYIVVWKYYMGALEWGFGKEYFSGEMREAWSAAYWQLAWLFMNREKELYAQSGWIGWKEFTVAKRVNESEHITSFYLAPKEDISLIGYKPGQYISVQKFVTELGTYQARQYSLSDIPTENQFRISVKRDSGIRATKPGTKTIDTADSTHPGWMSNLLHDTLQEGHTIQVAHPYGDFILEDAQSPVVLISAGVGATPFISMLNAIIRKTPAPARLSIIYSFFFPTSAPKTRQVSWIHAAHSVRDHAFKDHVADIVKARPHQVKSNIFLTVTDDAMPNKDYDFAGRMDLAKVSPEVLRLEDPATQYYLCGPPEFMNDMRTHLRSRGIDSPRIIMESFGVLNLASD